MAKNFNPGQRVVYIGDSFSGYVFPPQKDSIVTIKCRCDDPAGEGDECYDVIGYEVDPRDGKEQCFLGEVFEPLIELRAHQVKLESKKVLEESQKLIPIQAQ